MEAYAVVQTGGKQYRVKANDTLRVEHLDHEVGAQVDLDHVLAVSDGSVIRIGRPILDGVKVSSTVVDQIRGKKVVSFKKKRRKGYKRKVGHRQNLTILKINSIG